MKFLSLLILVLFLFMSWQIVHESTDVSEETHLGLQSDIQKIISDYIHEHLPESKNLKFEKIWTERTNQNQIKASFTYSFQDFGKGDNPARVKIDGYAILNRNLTDNSEFEIWNFDELFILNNHIQFEEAIKVTPSYDK